MSTDDFTEQLQELARLHEIGELSDEEFQRAKDLLLAPEVRQEPVPSPPASASTQHREAADRPRLEAAQGDSRRLLYWAIAISVSVFAGLAILYAIGPGSTPDGGPRADVWTQDVRDNFMDGCLEASGGQLEYCQCVLDDLEANYSVAEFERLEQTLERTGEMPIEVERTIERCIDQHLS